jgi:kynureninase
MYRQTDGAQSISSRQYAASLDQQDPLKHLRDEFLIPSKASLRSKSLAAAQENGRSEALPPQHANIGWMRDLKDEVEETSVYLCGNSLGLQPRRTSQRIQQYLSTWATQGVFGHFKPLSDSPLPTWLNVDEEAARRISPIVGASPSEVAVMQTLTANLHLLMCAFYRPDKNGRHKIILESKAFPSDHYAVSSQIRHHNLNPSESMIAIEPSSASSPIIDTQHILAVIDQHADTTALLLLPGIQFYSGQLLDIPTITSYARARGIFVIWDLAHAAGNVELKLHDWDVDAAAWCTYKYINAGPGSISGLFVHERHTMVEQGNGDDGSKPGFVNRLSGWWGNDKNSRFAMVNEFVPMPGAAGFQLSNPSVFDITSLSASLEVYGMTDMASLRAKSVKLTGYLEQLLLKLQKEEDGKFSIITPSDPQQRGAQLSLKLEEGLLETVMGELERNGVVVDERRPDVIRVAPAPLYNRFQDVFDFVEAFRGALRVASKAKADGKAGKGGTDELLHTT